MQAVDAAEGECLCLRPVADGQNPAGRRRDPSIKRPTGRRRERDGRSRKTSAQAVEVVVKLFGQEGRGSRGFGSEGWGGARVTFTSEVKVGLL